MTSAVTAARSPTPLPHNIMLNVLRALCILLIVLTVVNVDLLQPVIDQLYAYLVTTWVYNSVYFETWWTVTCYTLILGYPILLDTFSYLDKFKIDKSVHWNDVGLRKMVLDGLVYVAPLMLLDTFKMKRYYGVDPREWGVRAASWIQHTRALPVNPPSVGNIVYELFFSFIIYDAMFFVIHYCLHTNAFLYKHIHARHHQHETLNGFVTNQLTVTERIVLILSANESLKIMKSHPLTRTIFVPIFVGMLTENHTGYDLPWGLDKIVPFGLVGGSKAHGAHHMNGSRHYQPFFTYLDWLLQRHRDNKKSLHFQ